MSSQQYRDKSLEEVKAILERYCENYQRLFGVKPDLNELKARLAELKKEKEEEIFHQLFFTLSAKSLADCLMIADEMTTPKPVQHKGNKGKT